jgi:predicted PolB exonuclease-like 3'-5' exonuclease
MNTIQFIHNEICIFDIEFVPDVKLGRRLLGDQEIQSGDALVKIEDLDDTHVAALMVEKYANDRGIMKTMMYQVVSIAAVIRRWNGEVKLQILGRPDIEKLEDFSERDLISNFMNYVGAKKPQIVGYATHTFDLVSLWQRAIVNKLRVPEFCSRPGKPWEDAPDYFATTKAQNGYNVDLLKVLGNFNQEQPKLEQIALSLDIPAKIGGDGSKVAGMWFNGQHKEIIQYNECDALSTYMLWLNLVHTHGLLSTDQYDAELELFGELLASEREKRPHVGLFQDEWHRLSGKERIIDSKEERIEITKAELAKEADVVAACDTSQIDEKPPEPSGIVCVQCKTPAPEGATNEAYKCADCSLDPTHAFIAKSLGDLVTGKQLAMIKSLCKTLKTTPEAAAYDLFKCKLDDISKRSGSDLITDLQERIAQAETTPAEKTEPKEKGTLSVPHAGDFYRVEVDADLVPRDNVHSMLFDKEGPVVRFYDLAGMVLAEAPCKVLSVEDVPF